MIKIAPSILAADPLNLERDVLRVQEAGSEVQITYARLSGTDYRTMEIDVELGTKE